MLRHCPDLDADEIRHLQHYDHDGDTACEAQRDGFRYVFDKTTETRIGHDNEYGARHEGCQQQPRQTIFCRERM